MNAENRSKVLASLRQKWDRINLAFPALFWRRVNVGNVGACWNWEGTLSSRGYGTVKRLKKTELCHRVAYELIFGEIPKGMYVCHHCDNPKCCNPFHFFIGTNSDNQQDCIKKGRKPIFKGASNPMFGIIGEAHPSAKYTNEQILEIRRKYATGAFTQKALAAEYGTTQGSIGHIVRRLVWRHI